MVMFYRSQSYQGDPGLQGVNFLRAEFPAVFLFASGSRDGCGTVLPVQPNAGNRRDRLDLHSRRGTVCRLWIFPVPQYDRRTVCLDLVQIGIPNPQKAGF